VSPREAGHRGERSSDGHEIVGKRDREAIAREALSQKRSSKRETSSGNRLEEDSALILSRNVVEDPPIVAGRQGYLDESRRESARCRR